MAEAKTEPAKKEPATVPYFVYEAEQWRNEHRTKKAAILCAVAGAAAIAANAALVLIVLKSDKLK